MSALSVAGRAVAKRTGQVQGVRLGEPLAAILIGLCTLYVANSATHRMAVAVVIAGASLMFGGLVRTATHTNALAQMRPSRLLHIYSPAIAALLLAPILGPTNCERLALAVLAVAVADDFSGSFGTLAREAVLLTNGQTVPVGTAGSVTFPGTVAFQMAAGSFALACAFLSPGQPGETLLQLFFIGSVGCIVNTYLGATLRTSGLLSADQVNLATACVGGLLMGSFIVLR